MYSTHYSYIHSLHLHYQLATLFVQTFHRLWNSLSGVRVAAEDWNLPKIQGHLSGLTTKPGREDISTEEPPPLYCNPISTPVLSPLVVLDSAPAPTAPSPLKAKTPSANRIITLQLIFPHSTTGFHGLMIKIIHLNRFRLAVVAPLVAPLNSVGL